MRGSILMKIAMLITLCVTQNVAFDCGEVQIPIELVANGDESQHGEWPWLVSLHTKMQRGPDIFFCGALLINEWTLVTAAHCIRDIKVKAKHVRALLGRLNITDETEKHWTKRNISTIKIHENYGIDGKAYADSDIAVLILDEPVQFTRHIQPICLPSSDENVFNVDGTVAGYGNVNEASGHQKVQFHAKLSTIKPEECLVKHRKAPDTVSVDNSFCAKSDASVPCVGDSGGPFMVESDEIWTLFGVVSYAFNAKCNARDFAVFVDVTKFVGWILSNSEFFICKDGSRRIPWEKFCDKVSHCDDASDEEHCVKGEVLEKDEYGSPLLTFIPFDATKIYHEDFGIASACDEKVEGYHIWNNTEIKFLPIAVSEIFPNLKEIEVKSCKVERISRVNFKNLKRLLKLDLQLNQIMSIEPSSFDDLISLKFLKLNGNKLKNLDASWFKNMKNLTVLNLNFNIISSLPENAFKQLTELEEINIGVNQLKSLPDKLFINNRKLVSVYLSENQFEQIPEFFFAGLTELEYLYMNEISISILNPNLFKDLTKLREIWLGSNKLKVLLKEVFQNNKKLRKIDLSANQLVKIDEELFDGIEYLIWVDLSGNKCIDKKFEYYDSFYSRNPLELNSVVKVKCS